MKDIILASTSERRKDILNKYNFKFTIIKKEIAEPVNKGDIPEELVMSFAFRKAYAVAKDHPESIVIGSDTVVVYKGEILSKPENKEDAFRMLELLSGKTHEVITGLSILNIDTGTKIIDFEKTKVKFRKLNKNIIDTYIASEEPHDKAGSYAIQGLGALLVDRIEGSYLNIVGLPLVKLDKLLNKYFDISIINMNK